MSWELSFELGLGNELGVFFWNWTGKWTGDFPLDLTKLGAFF